MTAFMTCRHPEQMVFPEAISKWPDPNLPYTFTSLPPGITLEQAIAAAEWAFGPKTGWSKVCGIKPKYVETARNARVLIGSRRIDGPGGVLADCYLPSPGVSQVNLQFDTGDAWDASLPLHVLQMTENANDSMPFILQSKGDTPRDRQDAARAILYALTLQHEGGHSWGCGHSGMQGKNVMDAYYNENIKEFGQWEINEARKRYGLPTPTPPIPPVIPPAPTPGGTMGGFLGTFIIGLLKSQLEKWLADGTLQKWLEELLKRLAAGQLKTVEQLAEAAELSMPLAMRDP